MNREDLIELIKRIQKAQDSEEEIDNLINIFLKNVPDPNATEYIYGKEYENLSAEEIADKALSYKGFQL